MKTREEIRGTTTGKIPRPANYKYGEKLMEWDASLAVAGEPDLLTRIWQLLNDRILVRLIDDTPKGSIILTDAKPLIGGACRKAEVLKCGPGKLIEGEWWKVEPGSVSADVLLSDDNYEYNDSGWWQWNPSYRRPVAVHPGQIVYIGNWVDLEAGGLALCQEGDVRGYV